MFIYHNRIRWILGFDPAEMVGFKAYEYFHPGDLMATSSCHTQCKLMFHSIHIIKQRDTVETPILDS